MGVFTENQLHFTDRNPHLTGNFLSLFDFFLFVLFFLLIPVDAVLVPEPPSLSEDMSSGLWGATHALCAGGRQRGSVRVSGVFVDDAADSSPESRELRGGEERR